MKNTPAPWRYEQSTKTIRAMPSNCWLATMDSWDGAVNHEANALLIAAAPSLLDAVQVVRDALAKNVYECGHPGTWATKLDDMLAETIARAEGRL